MCSFPLLKFRDSPGNQMQALQAKLETILQCKLRLELTTLFNSEVQKWIYLTLINMLLRKPKQSRAHVKLFDKGLQTCSMEIETGLMLCCCGNFSMNWLMQQCYKQTNKCRTLLTKNIQKDLSVIKDFSAFAWCLFCLFYFFHHKI